MSAPIRVDGRTRLFAIVGDPIEQVRSPQVFTERFAELGANAVLLPVQVAPDRFDEVFAALKAIGNLDGLVVTVPYKPRALAHADRVSAGARCVGALNVLRREQDGTWTGDMFDGVGFVRAAERKGAQLRGRRAALFGAGGAGSAIAAALADAGVARVALIDPVEGKAEAVAAKLREAFPGCGFDATAALPAGADLIVNASTVGMRAGDGLPGDVGPLAADTLVGDVIVSEQPTALLRHAQQAGCAWVNGRDMHGGQAEAIVAFFASALARSRAAPGR
jgi:shikimate dehydrogenase